MKFWKPNAQSLYSPKVWVKKLMGPQSQQDFSETATDPYAPSGSDPLTAADLHTRLVLTLSFFWVLST